MGDIKISIDDYNKYLISVNKGEGIAVSSPDGIKEGKQTSLVNYSIDDPAGVKTENETSLVNYSIKSPDGYKSDPAGVKTENDLISRDTSSPWNNEDPLTLEDYNNIEPAKRSEQEQKGLQWSYRSLLEEQNKAKAKVELENEKIEADIGSAIFLQNIIPSALSNIVSSVVNAKSSNLISSAGSYISGFSNMLKFAKYCNGEELIRYFVFSMGIIETGNWFHDIVNEINGIMNSSFRISELGKNFKIKYVQRFDVNKMPSIITEEKEVKEIESSPFVLKTGDNTFKKISKRFSTINSVNDLNFGLIADYGTSVVFTDKEGKEKGSSNQIAIPFEFNPSISEGNVAAQYQATQIINRIGSLQSYVGTDPLTLSVSTKYYALSKNGEDKKYTDGFAPFNGPYDEMISYFNLNKIKEIEYYYRSLTYPDYEASSSNDLGTYYKPPIVKIIIGKNNSTNYLFTKPVKNDSSYQYKYRTFIVTGVTIDKKFDDYPFITFSIDNSNGKANDYITKDQLTIDTVIGFDVSFSLVEIDTNYFNDGGFSGFKSYLAKEVRNESGLIINSSKV